MENPYLQTLELTKNYFNGFNSIEVNNQLCFELIIFGFMIVDSYLFFQLLHYFLKKYNYAPFSLYISSIHALIASFYFVYRVVEYGFDYYQVYDQDFINQFNQNYYCIISSELCMSTVVRYVAGIINLIVSSLQDIYFYYIAERALYVWPSRSDLIYMYILSWTTSYSFFDTEKLYEIGGLWRSGGTILIHHIGMFLSMLLLIGLFLSGNHEYDFLISLAFLSELSTPILNYLKISHQNNKRASMNCYYLFAAVYFFCRPVNLSIVTYRVYQLLEQMGGIGSNSFLTISLASCVFFLLLNIFWFMAILRKFYAL